MEDGGEREGRRGDGTGGEGGMTVIHILIGMFNRLYSRSAESTARTRLGWHG